MKHFSLVPDGEQQSMISLVEHYSNLVVIRSLTKLFGAAGLRVGYAIAHPDRLKRWASWRDPWPVNGIAAALTVSGCWFLPVVTSAGAVVAALTAIEGVKMQRELVNIPGITPVPSAANFLISGLQLLGAAPETLEREYRILLRDCRSFVGLGENWLRIGLQSSRDNRRILCALNQIQRLNC